MDRLVCGDVGFGKTEVALRAAFVAVHGGKQVAILAPTTLLAEQHYQTLVDRFGKWPVKVAEMSRFRSAKEVKAAMQGWSRRHGRHRRRHAQAAQRGREVQAPGPADHRRGAPLRRAPQGGDQGLRAEVDVLTLTATPIPRTLGMALEGLRDLSVIATAPQRRWRSRPSCDPRQRRDPRGGAARAEARRPGLLPAQRGRDDREPARQAGRAAARGAHRRRPRPDARARAGSA
jgi:transcription-repair coupling factor (superfamily II helicase)